MTKIAIIAALPRELKPLVRRWRHECRNGVEIWRHDRNQHEWVAACAGIGEKAALKALAEVENDGPVGQIYSTGYAGALRENLKAGQVFHICGVVDAQTGERFVSADQSTNCWLVTSRIVVDKIEKSRLASRYEASLVDMEAAALARLASTRRIPFHSVKAVSDALVDGLPEVGRFIAADGKFDSLRFTRSVLVRPWRWRALIRLAQNSNSAAKNIRLALLAIMENATP